MVIDPIEMDVVPVDVVVVHFGTVHVHFDGVIVQIDMVVVHIRRVSVHSEMVVVPFGRVGVHFGGDGVHFDAFVRRVNGAPEHRRGNERLAHHFVNSIDIKEFVMADEVIVPGPHMEGAKALLDEIRGMYAKIPRFVAEEPNDARKLASAAAVSDAFVESAGASIDRLKRLETAAATDALTLRDSYGFALAYDAVVVEAYAFARAMAHTIRVQRAKAGLSALDIYSIAQRLAKRKDGAEFVPHVEDMRRKLKRGRKRKTTSEPAPVPAATSAP